MIKLHTISEANQVNDAIVLGKLGDVERMLKNIEAHLNRIDKKLDQIHIDLP